ncbi:MAG: hypothetical protein U5N86_07920 [Planctomycetota bacterium]|nr:hypothetical protein [Planctomycetota bacterium]
MVESEGMEVTGRRGFYVPGDATEVGLIEDALGWIGGIIGGNEGQEEGKHIGRVLEESIAVSLRNRAAFEKMKRRYRKHLTKWGAATEKYFNYPPIAFIDGKVHYLLIQQFMRITTEVSPNGTQWFGKQTRDYD